MNAETVIRARIIGDPTAMQHLPGGVAVGLPSADDDWPLAWVRQGNQRPFDRTTVGFTNYESVVEVGIQVEEGNAAGLDNLRRRVVELVDQWPDPDTVGGVKVLWAELLGGVETDVEFEERGLTSALAFRIVWRVA